MAQQFTQGNITATDNPMDLAINGAGFFQVRDGSSPTPYTRNGQFKVDHDGYIVNNQGSQLMGYPADATGHDPARRRDRAAAADRRHHAAARRPRIKMEMNLDSRAGGDAAGAPARRSTSPTRPPTTTRPR